MDVIVLTQWNLCNILGELSIGKIDNLSAGLIHVRYVASILKREFASVLQVF